MIFNVKTIDIIVAVWYNTNRISKKFVVNIAMHLVHLCALKIKTQRR